MTIYDAIVDFFDINSWQSYISITDEYGSIVNIELVDIVCAIVGIILIISMFKLFGIVIKKVIH